jgi:hypothetical protein
LEVLCPGYTGQTVWGTSQTGAGLESSSLGFVLVQVRGLFLEVVVLVVVSYGPPWAHCLGGYQNRLLGGPLGLPGLCHTTPDGVRRKDCGGEVLG